MDLSSICVPASVKTQVILCKEIALTCFNVSIKTVAIPEWECHGLCFTGKGFRRCGCSESDAYGGTRDLWWWDCG